MKIDLIDMSGEIFTFTVWDNIKDRKELNVIPDVLLNSLKALRLGLKKVGFQKIYKR